MFHRLHIQFTLFFTLGTSLILAAMTGICLYISQSSLTDGSYQTFVNSVSSALSYLEAQNTIPHQWIREQEQNNHFSIRILDNQHPLFFSQLEEEPALTPVYQAALDKAKQDYALDLDTYTEKSMLPQHVEFRMDDSGQSDYYASVAFLPKSNGSLSVITLYPLDLLHQQLSRQRLFFPFADLVGILSLALFSWIYTGKLLIPIQKNRRQQTQFIASASHELRTPLAVIRSCLSALQKGSPGDALHFQQIIDQETQRMTSPGPSSPPGWSWTHSSSISMKNTNLWLRRRNVALPSPSLTSPAPPANVMRTASSKCCLSLWTTPSPTLRLGARSTSPCHRLGASSNCPCPTTVLESPTPRKKPSFSVSTALTSLAIKKDTTA